VLAGQMGRHQPTRANNQQRKKQKCFQVKEVSYFHDSIFECEILTYPRLKAF